MHFKASQETQILNKQLVSKVRSLEIRFNRFFRALISLMVISLDPHQIEMSETAQDSLERSNMKSQYLATKSIKI